MATQLKTRILNKIDSYQNWLATGSIVLQKGEIGIATIETADSKSGLTPPATGIKVGDGTSKFSALPWIQAIAGDVSTFVKEKLTSETAFNTLISSQVTNNQAVKDLDNAIDQLTPRVTALETTVGNEESGLVKQVNALDTTVSGHSTTISGHTTQIGNKVDKSVAEAATASDKLVKKSTVTSDISTAKSALETKITTAQNAADAAKTQADKGVSDAAAAKTAADGAQGTANSALQKANANATAITGINTDITELQEAVGLAEGGEGNTLVSRVAALETTVGSSTSGLVKTVNDHGTTITNHEDRLDAIEPKVTKLIGSDTNKSVRTIAAEELAAKLIPSDAAESMNTLEEIAAWIQDHPGDAATMNTSISNNTKAISDLTGTVTQNKTDLDNRIDTVAGNLTTTKNGIMGTATYGTDTIGTVKAAASAAKTQADKGVSDAAAAKSRADAAYSLAETANTASGTALNDAKSYADDEIKSKATNRIDAIVGSSVADADGVISTISFTADKIQATRKKVDMNDMSDTEVFVFYCGTATEVAN